MYKLNEEAVVKRELLFATDAGKIYHRGWGLLRSISVEEMEEKQRKDFIFSLSTRKVYSITNQSIYLY